MYAYWCLHSLGIMPSDFIKMDKNEKAFVIAAIDIYIEGKEKRK